MSYNLDKLNELSGGDKDFNVSIIEVFLSETPADMESLEGAVNAGDHEKIYQHAHKIKPNADLLGMNDALEAVLAIEGHARGDKDMDAIRSLTQTVKAELDKAYPFFKDYIG
ncbi:Hpt domain-containing protein [Robertkochia flava]|uniref:Hpt domain-containing protein n=1 Tax=Robertkochia flava TaxID=3447986 RepID=UPI001CCA8566|nr:Hpt domain-containing protein [Robertkochia marina]